MESVISQLPRRYPQELEGHDNDIISHPMTLSLFSFMSYVSKFYAHDTPIETGLIISDDDMDADKVVAERHRAVKENFQFFLPLWTERIFLCTKKSKNNQPWRLMGENTHGAVVGDG